MIDQGQQKLLWMYVCQRFILIYISMKSGQLRLWLFTLAFLLKISADRILKYLSYFSEGRVWHFIDISLKETV